VNARWVKSSFSFANGNCVEVAGLPGDTVGIRDGRDPGGPVLRFTRAEWDAFLSRAGRTAAGTKGAERAGCSPSPPGLRRPRIPGPARHDLATCRSCRTRRF